MCELAHCGVGAGRLESDCPFFYEQFLDADVSIRCIVRTNYGTPLLKIVMDAGYWIEVIDPCFILSYDPVDKIRFILVAREKIS
jgi:hypothetical protein